MPGPILARGDAVTLRTLEPEDLPFVQRSFANPSLRHPLGNPNHLNRTGVEQLYEGYFEDEHTSLFLVTVDEESAGPGHPEDGSVTPVGAVTISNAPWNRPDVAYWLVPERHGQGYGSEAVALALDSFFRTADAPSIGAEAYDHNEASIALLESLGFTREGRRRKARFVDGAYRDAVAFGLLREEWDRRD